MEKNKPDIAAIKKEVEQIATSIGKACEGHNLDCVFHALGLFAMQSAQQGKKPFALLGHLFNVITHLIDLDMSEEDDSIDFGNAMGLMTVYGVKESPKPSNAIYAIVANLMLNYPDELKEAISESKKGITNHMMQKTKH